MSSRTGSGNPGILRIIGFHAIEAQVARDAGAIESVAIDNRKSGKRLDGLVEALKSHGIPVHRADRSQLDAMSDYQSHQGVVANLLRRQEVTRGDLDSMLDAEPENSVVLVLDHIQDPHNLGACLRTAECAGVRIVILPKKGASPITDTVRKVSSGAADQLYVHYVANIGNAIGVLKEKGYWVYGTSDRAEDSLYECRFAGKTALIMGSEGSGMGNLLTQSCDHLLRIPLTGSVSSLNVSVATGVCLFEIVRQNA